MTLRAAFMGMSLSLDFSPRARKVLRESNTLVNEKNKKMEKENVKLLEENNFSLLYYRVDIRQRAQSRSCSS